VNDMIIAVNGKRVGGMTIAGFEIELDQSGPDMVVLVSRYLFADDVRESIVQAEQAYLHAVDAAINDDRLLGWTDISVGNASAVGTRALVKGTSRDVVADETGKVNQKPDNTTFVDCRPKSTEETRIDRIVPSSVVANDLPDRVGGSVTAQPGWDLEAFGNDSDSGCRTVPSLHGSSLGQESVGLEIQASRAKDFLPHFVNSDKGKNQVAIVDSELDALFSFRLSSKHGGAVESEGVDGNENRKPIHATQDDEALNSESQVSMKIGQRVEASPIEHTNKLPVAFGQREWSDAIERQNDASSGSDSTVPENQDRGNESDQDDNKDDGNAWCGCVCGKLHRKSGKHKEIFWIQCEVCSTWYDSSSHCLKFTQRQVESVNWKCWGCDEDRTTQTESPDANTCTVSRVVSRISTSPMASEQQRLSSQSPARTKQEHDVNRDDARSQSDDETKVSQDHSDRTGDVFVMGDFVYINEHAWSGVNNPEGVAKVLKAYIDDEGDQVYDIRYVVGGLRKGVLPEYLRSHNFD
jgi:hypothetical protein